MVPPARLELARPCGHLILSERRLPFRQGGIYALGSTSRNKGDLAALTTKQYQFYYWIIFLLYPSYLLLN